MEEIKKLLDAYRTSGNDYEAFKDENAAMADITKNIVVNGSDIMFLSICDVAEAQVPGKVTFYVLDEARIENFLEKGEIPAIGRVKNELIPEELLDELRATTGLIIACRNGSEYDKYIVSNEAIPTLTLRASVGGGTTMDRQNLIRNMHIADGVIAKKDTVNIVYREIGGVKKCFATLGGKFTEVPQTILSKVADKIADERILGKMDVNSWSIDHTFSNIHIEFPEAGEDYRELYDLPDTLVPGLTICTSDIGRSSIIARGVYRRKGGRSYIIEEEVAMKHMSKATPEKILEEIDKSIFSRMRLLPETLATLIGIEVKDPEREVRKMAKKALKTVLPAKRLEELISLVCAELDMSRPYTMYDVAILFMDLPERIKGLDYVTLANVQKACAKVPYELAPKAAKKEEEELYLLSS